MAKEYLKGWFGVTQDYSDRVKYITSAYDEADARRNLGFHAKNRPVIQLNWRELRRFTGCPIPHTATPDDFACSDLMLERDEGMVVVCSGL